MLFGSLKKNCQCDRCFPDHQNFDSFTVFLEVCSMSGRIKLSFLWSFIFHPLTAFIPDLSMSFKSFPTHLCHVIPFVSRTPPSHSLSSPHHCCALLPVPWSLIPSPALFHLLYAQHNKSSVFSMLSVVFFPCSPPLYFALPAGEEPAHLAQTFWLAGWYMCDHWISWLLLSVTDNEFSSITWIVFLFYSDSNFFFN